jgi:hypothetical protein
MRKRNEGPSLLPRYFRYKSNKTGAVIPYLVESEWMYSTLYMYMNIILLARTAISKSPRGPHWLGLSIEYILYRFSFYIPPRMNVSVIEKEEDILRKNPATDPTNSSLSVCIFNSAWLLLEPISCTTISPSRKSLRIPKTCVNIYSEICSGWSIQDRDPGFSHIYKTTSFLDASDRTNQCYF